MKKAEQTLQLLSIAKRPYGTRFRVFDKALDAVVIVYVYNFGGVNCTTCGAGPRRTCKHEKFIAVNEAL